MFGPVRVLRLASDIITGLSKNRGDQIIVHLRFETGGKGQRYATELYWRKPSLRGR
ncbi:MAG: hypothetical protein JOZ36_10090 [Acidobacteria bacterium]|nr:hypothetical protein [Acidobacteriota bacterium]